MCFAPLNVGEKSAIIRLHMTNVRIAEEEAKLKVAQGSLLVSMSKHLRLVMNKGIKVPVKGAHMH